jgi:hypothetical protein
LTFVEGSGRRRLCVHRRGLMNPFASFTNPLSW